MTSHLSPQEELFIKYVAGTTFKERITLAKTFICNLGTGVFKIFKVMHSLNNPKVFVSTKVLKHIYDDHKAQHLTIIQNLHRILRLPDVVYKNKPEKGGNYIFMKKLNGKPYAVIIDIITENELNSIEVRTGFYMSYPDRYLQGHDLVWKSKE